MSIDRPHAERSASQLGHLLLCAGYQPLQKNKTHWVTAQGIRGHGALDSGYDGNLESTFEERMVNLCEAYSSKFVKPNSKVYNEIRVETIEGRWGYIDRLIVNGTDAILVDWKFVRTKEVTDAEHNLQSKDYVIGIFEDSRFKHIESIHVHFVMPRFETVTHTTKPYDRTNITQLKLEVYSVLAKSRHTDKKSYRGGSLTPHYDVCKYCGAAGRCVALRKIADKIGRAYDPEGYGKQPSVPVQTHASLIKDNKEKAQLQELASLMEAWASSVRQHNLQSSLENEKNLPEGYFIDYAKGRRYVTDAAALLLVSKEFGIGAQELIDAASLSWTKVEQILKDKAGRGMKSRVVSDFNQRLLELNAIDRPEPSARLARLRNKIV